MRKINGVPYRYAYLAGGKKSVQLYPIPGSTRAQVSKARALALAMEDVIDVKDATDARWGRK